MAIWAYRRSRQPLLRLQRKQWRDLIKELGRRGEGRREAGAFLLAPRNDMRQVTRIEYFDDLDPDCLRGNILIDGRAFSKLWDICDRERLIVAGDVHTHPRTLVQQSTIDRDHPMVARAGHVALIVPRLAVRAVRPRQVGVHEYKGEDGWVSWFGRDAAARLSVKRWP